MGIPEKALRLSQLEFLTDKNITDSSHQTYPVRFKEDGVEKNAFFKKLAPKDHYPELLAKISVGASSFKRAFQGKRSAEERLVFDDEDKLIGTLSISVENFKPFNFVDEGIPSNSTLREQVAPSTKTLIKKNIMEILFARWFLDDDDTHPHNISLEGDIDFDMFFYWFTIYMKEPRKVIGVPKNHVTLTVPDYRAFPNVRESLPYHWPTYEHPGEETIPVWLPYIQEQALKWLPKTYANPAEFVRLAQNSRAQEQKLAAAIKALLTYQPEVQRRRLIELFGDMPLNYTSLEEADSALPSKYEELFPRFCNPETNAKPFVDFMMDLYQDHYDNLYRVVVFHMGCLDNGYGVSLLPTYQDLYQKPSFYFNVMNWVQNENETTYAQEDALKYDLNELQIRYHQIWRDAFAPKLKELLYSSYGLINSLLKKATNPPHVKISEMVCKEATDKSLTSIWELFGELPELSAEPIEPYISVHKEHKLREGINYLIAFINDFQELIKLYYNKNREVLSEEDNFNFSKKLLEISQEYNLKIRQALMNTTSSADEFYNIAKSLDLIAHQINFQMHLTTTDELMKNALLSYKRDLLPFTHEDVKKQYYDSLFVWAKGLKPKQLERHILDIIDKKYVRMLSFCQRAEPVKKYLKNSANESGDNRLAYIFSSGNEEGSLNLLLVQELTSLMLQKYPIPSIDAAIRDKSFKKGLVDFTRDVVSFAKKEKEFIHCYSDRGMNILYKTIYDWVDSLKEKSFKLIINRALETYEKSIWSNLWGGSRRSEVNGYLRRNSNAKALALIFMNGEEKSTLNECVFVKIIETIKMEIEQKPEMLQEEKYKIIANINLDLDEEKKFLIMNLKDHFETNLASQLHPTYSCSY